MPSPILPAPDATTKRVSLRRRTASGALSDVVGHLIAANQDWMVVLPEDRGAVWVPRSEVETVRGVPERVVLPTSDAEGLERVFDRTWPGLRRARLGGWVLRSGRGASARANSVLTVGDPELPFDEAVAAAEQWNAGPVTLQAVEGGRREGEALAAGFRPAKPTVVLVREAGPGPSVGFERVDEPDAAWVAVAGMEPDRLAEAVAAPASYLRIGDVAVGRVAVSGRWAVLSCLEVRESARGLGHGREMLHALGVEAVRLGARYLGLQVEVENESALALYASEGFIEHHRYSYLTRG
ncbi:Acetyltransferase (GNAT) family protein [Tessaracoccus bendigoensis DSM 12906]|uniref:Acetyltransferase (GNAT) family protein n=1 Tax=Tessaracoccus bendigoensis DSM 12906 TaxID=1123357 RepID=A0A1M6I7N0_9ACTN|nr:GNAT family N-acetyltransferase [Tessaracoccus bendigoensis]SHJ30491.1 Acetyltransferase (GNAT) family protein [Tessaracoccus bendigoensis DSM 12906]